VNSTRNVGVVGLGITGVRTARELIGTAGVGDLLVSTDRSHRFDEVREVLGPRVIRLAENDVPSIVVLASEHGDHATQAERWIRRGADVVSVSDDPADVRALLGLDELATSLSRRVVVGVAASPGMSCVLVAHAAAALDNVDDVVVSSLGAGGPACLRHRASLLGRSGIEWTDHSWGEVEAGSSKLLTWFPDPIGAVDVGRGDLAEPLLVRRIVPSARRIQARAGVPPTDRLLGLFPRRAPLGVEGEPGAIRVDVTGQRQGVDTTITYGVLDRPAVIAAALVATVVGSLSQRVPGVQGAAEFLPVVDLLHELARRGVRCATPVST